MKDRLFPTAEEAEAIRQGTVERITQALRSPYDRAVDGDVMMVMPEERSTPKATKVQAGYTEDPQRRHCNECWMWVRETDEVGRCAIVDGIIKAVGTCNLWRKGRYMEAAGGQGLENPTKLGQVETGYMERPSGFTCATCQRFDPAGRCQVVYGAIKPEGCCNFWTDGQSWV